VRDSLCMGVGLGILANSRPYEGFVLGLLTLMALLMWAIQAEDVPASIIFRRVFAPMLVVLVLFGAQIAYYNWRVTGNPVQMPYMVHEDTYGIAPVFLFGTPRPEPTYLHADIRKFQEDCLAYFLSQRASFGALARAIGTKMWTLGQAYLWSYLMVLPLLALPWSLARDRWLWFALFMGLVFAITMMMSTWVYPHYAAPAAALFFVLVTQSMRRLHAWHIGTWRVGRNLVRGLAVLCVVSFFVVEGKVAAKDDRPSWYFLRQTMLKKLQALPQKSLVIVRYSKDHNPNREWVYNEANILGSKVILARDMGVENKELLDYFPDRKAWMVDADAADPQPEPITGS